MQMPLLLTLLLTLSFNIQAADNDNFSQQPVEIQANQLTSSEKEGRSIYQGKVHIQQGAFELNGDKVTIEHPNNQIQTLIAIGTPAKFKRFNPKDDSWVTGHAEQIIYNADKRIVTLIGNAQVQQPNKHQITGPKLSYDLNRQLLNATGNQQSNQRISVTLQPNANQ